MVEKRTAAIPNRIRIPGRKPPNAPPMHPKEVMIPKIVAAALELPFKDL